MTLNDPEKLNEAADPPRGSRKTTVMALVAACLLSIFAILAIFKAPIGFLWKPAVGATEFGHILALLALLPLLGAFNDKLGKVVIILSTINVLLLISPLIRAINHSSQVRVKVEETLGDQQLRDYPNAESRRQVFALSSLFSMSSPEIKVTTHKYKAKNGQTLVLDLYQRAELKEKQAVIVQIHGGSWNSGDQSQLPGINYYLAARGYTVAAITYRLAPEHIFPAAYEDVLGAIQHLKEHSEQWSLDSKRIILMGRSAGAHLALLCGYRPKDPDICGVIAFYPPTDMLWSWNNPTNPWVLDSKKTIGEFLGGTPETIAQVFHDASPINFVDGQSAPTVLIHGDRDELVFAAQSRRLAEQLGKSGVLHFHLQLPWASHGCEANLSGPSGQMSLYVIERFLAKVTSGKAAGAKQ
jgi:acetyl esterase/lipase